MKKTLTILVLFLLILGAGSYGLLAEEEIVIGANYEMTGPVATFGQACTNSAQLAVDEANAAGGVLGRKIKLVSADNKSDAKEALNMATKLITQDKAVILLGPVTSSDCLSAGPFAQEKGVPMITPTGTNPKVTKVGDYIFRVCFVDDFQGSTMANFARKTLKAKKAAMLVENQSDYAKGLAAFFKDTFSKAGGQIVADEAFGSDDKDFRALLNKVRLKKPDVLFVPSYYNTCGLIAKQAREMKMNMPILGGDGWDSPELIQIAGPKPLNKIFFSNHYDPGYSKNPMAVKYIKDYTARFKLAPDALAALGYDAAKLAIDAIARAKSTDPKAIRDALAATKGFEGVAGKITMNAERNPPKTLLVIELKNGVKTYKEAVEP